MNDQFVFSRRGHIVLIAGITLATLVSPLHAFTSSQKPVETQTVPGNLVLALSVEFPTGLQVSYTNPTYTAATSYLGYFDNKKCYSYDTTNEVFIPQSGRNTTGGACPTASHWNGNVLNWLTMTNVDQFRSVMTGGTRDNFSTMNSTYAGDNTTRTVLIRSLSDRNSYSVVKTIPAANKGVPSAADGKTARSGGFGSKFFYNNTGNFTDLNLTQQKESCAATVARNLAGMSNCFNIRVQVCETVPQTPPLPAVAVSPAVGRESNCISYAGNSYYKPQGLIQEYSGTLRFSAMGYLNDDDIKRNGGVLRAAMKSVGSKKIGEGNVANTNAEWGGNGILSTNPDTTDATASAVNQSGVINYLNKFGFDSGYKGYDPVGELYYAAQLYYRNQSFPTNYSNSLTAAMKDDFPVITTFSDPIVKSCSKNFILGIGDIYTHCDANLPGSTVLNTGSCGAAIPSDSNSAVQVNDLWNQITGFEGNSTRVGGATNPNGYMAGLAWWAHVNDIRSDLTGTQSISTYWVDVLENNNGGAGIGAKSQYWWATKYGGFNLNTLHNTNPISKNPNDAPLSWDANSDGKPDALFAGNDPVSLRAGLTAAFAAIAAEAADSSASSAAVTSNRQTNDSEIIYAGYDPKVWTGSVHACSPNQDAKTKTVSSVVIKGCDEAPLWEASRWFDPLYTLGASPKLTDTNRKIFTSDFAGSIFSKMPFLWSSLSTSQQGILNSTDSRGSDRTDFLRGNRSLEGSIFRVRGDALASTNPSNSYLGDIVNSNVTHLKGSGTAYKGANFPGHATYRAGNATRPATIYVGANDGMLHAFDASQSTVANNGKELWAYIPSAVFANLPLLTNPSYSHKFFVDGTAMLADTETGVSATPWRTMLVGGLGGGGRGYYALNITNQQTHASKNFSNMTQTELADIPMWEFTNNQDSDLGYTFNEPSVDAITGAFKQIAKVADTATATGVWRVVVGNGYGSTANKAALFFLNSESGAVATKLEASTSASDNGLSTPTPVDTDGDGLIDTVYAGDLLGKMHKFQFSKLAANNVDYIRAQSGDADGAWRYIGVLYDAGAPITTAPAVTKACSGSTSWQVLFGTGKLNEDADFTSTTNNSFYAVADNNLSSSLTALSSTLASISYTTAAVSAGTVRTWTPPNLTGKKGWKIEFTGGERIISNPTLPPDTGAVLFGTATPSGDLCAPGSTGFLMSVNICNADIGGLTLDGYSTPVGGLAIKASGILKVSNTYSNTNNKQTIVCNQSDCQTEHPPTLKSVVAPPGRYSWRELLSR